VALTVSSAEATTSTVGSLTYGDHHLSTNDSGHLRADAAPANGGRPSTHKEVITPVLATGVRTRPSGDADTALRRTTCCVTPSAASGVGRAVDVADLRTARPSPAWWTDSHPRPGSRWQFASSARLVNALLPQMLEEEAGRQPMRRTRPQLGLPSPPARMMNILEAEGKGEATARLALLHHKADGHILGDRQRGTAAGLHDENP
jgi:hypothetical protein